MGEDQDHPLKWDDADDPGWVSAVNAWPWSSIGGGAWAKSGSCPRCTHHMTVTAGGEVVIALGPTDRAAIDLMVIAEEEGIIVDPNDGSIYARCDCTDDHPGRPPRLKRGCGRAGYIDPPPET
jgi:hypothetical protein